MMWAEVHWYLIVVDMEEKLVLRMDSLPVEAVDAARMEQTAAVCQRLQEALVFGFPGRYSNDIGGFAYKTPTWCPRQPNGFDCGVYTMKLMQMTSVLWEGLQLELDSNTERVKIAIDLFLDEGNRARDRGMKMIRFMSLRK